MSARIIRIISDATGETAEKVMRAALLQFESGDFQIIRYHDIRGEKVLRDAMARARSGDILVSTLVDADLRALASSIAEEMDVLYFDLLGPLLGRLADYLGADMRNLPGIQHRMESTYRKRIEAVEYSVKHDDGLGLKTLPEAQIVIVGVSRTGKTPLSIYLANRGFKVANVPLVMGIPVAPELERMDSRRVIGLHIDPGLLREIRESRLRKLGSRIRTGYTEQESIARETDWARALYRKMGWHTIDVTRKAVEEIATEIEEIIRTLPD